MVVRQMDADTAESVAALMHLPRRASEVVWLQADADGPRSALRLLALGVDEAANECHARLRGCSLSGVTWRRTRAAHCYLQG